MSEEKRVSSSKKMKKKINPAVRRQRRISRRLSVGLFVVTILMAAAIIVNMVFVLRKQTPAANTDTATDTNRDMKNDLYQIGNNPTEFEKECFQKLTDALNSGTKEEQAEAVVECFVSDYFTWTNKDGNYEVGGLQYYYADKFVEFSDWSRYNYYKDLDLYIEQYGSDNLPAVASITVDVPTKKVEDFDVRTMDPPAVWPCYQVEVSWTYTMGTALNDGDFIHAMRFLVVDHDGRMEIVEFYDMDSVREWEKEHGSSEAQE